MSIRNIIQEIENTDTQSFEKTSDRRDILKQFGAKVALAALPLAIGSMFNKAKAADDSSAANALNVILRHKYLEADFYTTGIALISSLISAEDRAAIAVISAHENAHVATLKKTLDSLGAPSTLKPVFDFTAHGAFPDVFTSYTTFMEVAQMIEDAGVRIIKGQLEGVHANRDILATVLRMHSTEGRHASHVRMMRRLYFSNRAAKPWITSNQSANIDVAAAQIAYEGEDNIMQGTFNITTLTGMNGLVALDAATEAFDEPLGQNKADAIIQLFTA